MFNYPKGQVLFVTPETGLTLFKFYNIKKKTRGEVN